VIARHQTEHGSGLGRHRWVVERTFAWLHHYKRLLVRYDRRHEIHEAFLALACCLVCFRRLHPSSETSSKRERSLVSRFKVGPMETPTLASVGSSWRSTGCGTAFS
jgi:hypothetical protein